MIFTVPPACFLLSRLINPILHNYYCSCKFINWVLSLNLCLSFLDCHKIYKDTPESKKLPKLFCALYTCCCT